jgi:hypothetical protein
LGQREAFDVALAGECDAIEGREGVPDAQDRAILDEKADGLNREMEDVLAYQVTPAVGPRVSRSGR